MARGLLVVALVAAPMAAAAQAPQACPWLNAGTAARVLGSAVASTLHVESDWKGSCEFVRSSDPEASIAVTVGRKDTHPCNGATRRISGVANQAVLCAARGKNGQRLETVSGQVRDAWFVVTLSAPPENTGVPHRRTESADSSQIEFLAEQVAGNLY